METFVFASGLLDKDKFDKIVNQVFYFLRNLEVEYRGFSAWYWNKVVPSVLVGDKEMIVAKFNREITGVIIIKNEANEKKICTLRVKKEFRNHGIGRRLMEMAFMELNTQEPFITVSSMRIMQFKNIFKYYGFKPSAIYNNYYNSGRIEICFNGSLPGNVYLPEYGAAMRQAIKDA